MSEVEYRNVPGYEGYRVGSDGSVWTCLRQRSCGRGGGTFFVVGTEWKRLNPRPGNNGYLSVCLRTKKRILVHRLVLQTFVGPCPEGMECRHLNGNRTDNRLSNLAWGTHAKNVDDTRQQGRLRSGNRKLTPAQVREIRELAGTVTQKEIAARFGISSGHVSVIVNGVYCTEMSQQGYGLVDAKPGPGVPRGERSGNAVLKEEQVREIRRLRADGMSFGKIAKQFGRPLSTIQAILERRTWGWLE